MTTAAQRDAAIAAQATQIAALQAALAKETADRIAADALLASKEEVSGWAKILDAHNDADYQALEKRIAALEGTPPPIDPPPIPPSTGPTVPAGLASGAITLQQAIDQAMTATAIGVPPRTFHELITIPKTLRVEGVGGLPVIDLTGFPIPVQASGVNVKGTSSVVKGIRITGSSASGYTVDEADVAMIDIEVDHCVEEGRVWHGPDGLVQRGENHHNNESGQFWDSGEQGAGKANCQRLVIDGEHVHHIGLGGASPDAGQGIWYDSINQVSTGTVKNCLIHDVYYAGIMYEISKAGKLLNNVIHHCGTTPRPWQASGIFVSTSRDVEVAGNLVAYCKATGIRVVQQKRDEASVAGTPAPPVTGINVHDNTLIGNGTAIGFDSDYAANDPVMFGATAGNLVARNHFDVPRVYWKPKGTLTTLAQINALPGGGGNTQLTPAEVATALAQFGIVA